MDERAKRLLDNLLMSSLAVAIAGSVFKTMHWPWGNILLLYGLSTLAIAALIKYASEKTVDGYITGITIALVAIAFLFKVLHWPNSDMLIKLAIAAAVVWGARMIFAANKPNGD